MRQIAEIKPLFRGGAEVTERTNSDVRADRYVHRECLGSWQQGTAFVLPDGRCCFTWATPYGQGEKLPFAVPATVDMSGWNLVPPFHVE